MSANKAIKKALNLNKTTIVDVWIEEKNNQSAIMIEVKPFKKEQHICPFCGKICPGYDRSTKTRYWRALDIGTMQVYLKGNATRIKCKEHGVVAASIPWARHDSDYTYEFETAVTWLALHSSASSVSEFFRIKWGTVGSIARRVQESKRSQENLFDNLEEIGIDETSYKKGHKYMTVIVNHKTGALIWAHKGHGKEVLMKFFNELTQTQRESIKLVSADGARWIADCIKEFCPNAERCVDPFHVVTWAQEVLETIRKDIVREAKKK